VVPELDGPPCPVELAYLLEWFLELAAARGSSGFAPSPISFGEIAAWARLMRIRPSPNEVGVLRRLDQAFLLVVIEHGRHSSNPHHR
jgi:hypothetical protein